MRLAPAVGNRRSWWLFKLIENMMLAAHSLGIGSCFIGRAAETLDTAEGSAIAKAWNVDDGYVAIGHCILGYPEGTHPQAKPRKEFVVKWLK